jgi:hypothetical protein
MTAKMQPDVSRLIDQLVAIVEHNHATPKLRAEAITHAYEIGVIEGRLQGAQELSDRLKRVNKTTEAMA